MRGPLAEQGLVKQLWGRPSVHGSAGRGGFSSAFSHPRKCLLEQEQRLRASSLISLGQRILFQSKLGLAVSYNLSTPRVSKAT